MQIYFSKEAKSQLDFWQKNDIKIYQKILTFIEEIKSTPYKGQGIPKPLKHNLSGYWSRRIDQKHRLVYKICNNTIIVIRSCKNHY